MEHKKQDKLPVVILTGFLGSGKTTVLNHVVNQPGMSRTAVIINEFGEIGIDHLLVESSEEQMIEMNNGCICCTIRGDLADKLSSLAMWMATGRIPPIDRIIVETTGLADPAPIMHTLMTDENLLNKFRLDSVLTVVDAIAGSTSLVRFEEAFKQVAIADNLILSKVDLIEQLSSAADFERLKQQIHTLNPRAKIHEVSKGVIDPETLFVDRGEDAEATFSDFNGWLEAAKESTQSHDGHSHDCHSDHCADPDHDHHRHEHQLGGINSFVIELTEPVDSEPFNSFLQDLAIEFGDNLLRMKGILNVKGTPDKPAVFHGVQHVFFPVTWLESWPDEGRSSKLVFITQDMQSDVIRGRFQAHFA